MRKFLTYFLIFCMNNIGDFHSSLSDSRVPSIASAAVMIQIITKRLPLSCHCLADSLHPLAYYIVALHLGGQATKTPRDVTELAFASRGQSYRRSCMPVHSMSMEC